MSQFKVGPAKIRSGEDCEILDICTDGTLIGKRHWDEVGWISMHRYANGYVNLHGTSCEDILPNVEPEWVEYVVWHREHEGYQRVETSTWYGQFAGEAEDDIEHFRYRHAPGHPIQIISGDFVDAREKDDDAH